MKSSLLKINSWNVQLKSDTPELNRVVHSRIDPLFWRKYDARRTNIKIEFKQTLNRTMREMPLGKLYEGSHPARGDMKVTAHPKMGNESWLYHVGFLQPLSVALLAFRSTLVHAGLVAKNGEGVLIVGQSGAGKSTLSLLCALGEYELFSDEHTIATLSSGNVIARPFYGPVAVAKHSLQHLPKGAAEARWDGRRKKYLISEGFNVAPTNSRCRITKVIFPSFSIRTKLSVEKLSAGEAMRLLLGDEYVGMSTISGLKSFTKTHLKILEGLALKADCYQMRYGLRDVRNIPNIIGALGENSVG